MLTNSIIVALNVHAINDVDLCPGRTGGTLQMHRLSSKNNQWLGRFLGITGWEPSFCKSNRLHVDICQFSFIKLGYISHIPLKWSVNFLQSWTSTGYFSNSTGSSVTSCLFSPIIWNNRLKFITTSGNSPTILQESIEDTSDEWKYQNRKDANM